jgi:hypothetical protein
LRSAVSALRCVGAAFVPGSPVLIGVLSAPSISPPTLPRGGRRAALPCGYRARPRRAPRGGAPCAESDARPPEPDVSRSAAPSARWCPATSAPKRLSSTRACRLAALRVAFRSSCLCAAARRLLSARRSAFFSATRASACC